MGTQMLREAFNDKADLQRMKDHNYAMGGKLEEVGRIATNANQESAEFKDRKEKKKDEERRLREILDRSLQEFFDSMDNWSSQDFKDFNKNFSGKLREDARKSYENGDFNTYTILIDQADKYDEQANAIWNDPNMTDEEKREANRELIKDQDPELLKQYLVSERENDPKVEAGMDEYNSVETSVEEDAELTNNNASATSKAQSFDFS